MIHYLIGDATHPIGDGAKVIVHICNDVGKWGAGFTRALSRRWPLPEAVYRDTFAFEGLRLGTYQFVWASADITVANIIGQHGVRSFVDVHPIRYDAVEAGLRQVADFTAKRGASVHMPRIGCGLAGGTWGQVEPIIQRTLCSRGVDVYVYDLPGGRP